MDIVTPDLGLIVWTTIIFLLVLFILARFAWRPILGAVKAREESIHQALQSAERAKAELTSLKGDNEKLLQDARAERDAMIVEAKQIRERMIVDSKTAAENAGRIELEQARNAIQSEKAAALAEMKNLAAGLSLQIAERVLRDELGNPDRQAEYVRKQLADISLN